MSEKVHGSGGCREYSKKVNGEARFYNEHGMSEVIDEGERISLNVLEVEG